MSASEPNHVPNTNGQPSEATLLLRRVEGGDSSAAAELLPLVYEQLRATAGSFFRAQSSGHTLQPTALVHEAYVKLVGTSGSEWEGRAHFCAVAAMAMRQILQDHARAKGTSKRGGGRARTGATNIESPSRTDAIDIFALEEALMKLAAINEQDARIVELRFFGGLTNEQVADLIGVSRPTVERSWRRSRAWLRAQLAEDAAEEGLDP